MDDRSEKGRHGTTHNYNASDQISNQSLHCKSDLEEFEDTKGADRNC